MLGASQVIGANSHGAHIAASAASSSSDSSADRFERGTIRRIEAKEHVFCDGDPRTHVFRIEEGVIALSKLLGDGRRQIIEFAYPGDYIGLGTLREHIFDAQATCPAKVRCLSATALEQEAARDAGLALRLYKAVSAELAAARSLLVSVGQQSAMERLAGFLLSLSARAPDGEENVVKLPMRRSDIADLLGLTIETVSRTITKLRTMHVIDVVRGTEVHILDSDRLAELAGQ
ncbi:Crp/Fnr family transcriptional regulator [Hyphomicrobium sp. MC1]|uniref:Crp/Fnr family transcriptional regulator n=1 Tax=Hyphomicrobium sp. (strain MC1) TaxID=717785 RepID=UPI000213E144|nr:helix-turn-helix domain-containing protein [Hyphomicrobium sp. MC1]CCB63907.1 Transcriptional regulator, Crp/Fnr family [Hyphomicrobium sp. MC1]